MTSDEPPRFFCDEIENWNWEKTVKTELANQYLIDFTEIGETISFIFTSNKKLSFVKPIETKYVEKRIMLYATWSSHNSEPKETWITFVKLLIGKVIFDRVIVTTDSIIILLNNTKNNHHATIGGPSITICEPGMALFVE